MRKALHQPFINRAHCLDCASVAADRDYRAAWRERNRDALRIYNREYMRERRKTFRTAECTK